MLPIKTAALAAVLALPGLAAADVPIKVPSTLLGGRVAPGNPLPPQAPDAPAGFDDNEVDIEAEDFWNLVWPSEAAPIAMTDSVDCDEELEPGACAVWNDAAAELMPSGAATQSVQAPPEANLAPARRLRPGLGAWMASQTPTLRWEAEPGASHYHVQIYLGPRRVASAWTARTRLTLPPRLIHQGRYYMWSVWPATGPRRSPVFGPQIGRSVFGVVLRPRVVFRAAPGSSGLRAVGEVRPRIPGGVLTIAGPVARSAGLPRRVRIDATSRIRLALPRADAERITLRLVDVGDNPPKGLRR